MAVSSHLGQVHEPVELEGCVEVQHPAFQEVLVQGANQGHVSLLRASLAQAKSKYVSRCETRLQGPPLSTGFLSVEILYVPSPKYLLNNCAYMAWNQK